jgi:eukaryotic-like serine/threonine-protein kinase
MLAGRYELGEELGSGAVGRVFSAHDQVLGRDVAVKLLSPDSDAVTRQRFVREARTAARLHHPNAVAVYDTGEADGQPYLVMELVRGQSLADLIERQGPLEIDEAVAITAGVLQGLEAAHRAGMVHRDVKPGNVLLPDDGGVKLSDFGIAKALDDESADVTMAGVLMGTPTYLAPELLVGEPPSPASDVYGVGCLLYAQLTGDPPFTRGDAMAIAYAHRNEAVPAIESRRPDVPADLAAVTMRALAKEPGERYPTASAMRTALLEGPDAVAATDDAATVAIASAVARDRTAVLDHSDEPTRAVGAVAPPARTEEPAAPPAQRKRRPWPAIIAVVLVLLAALVLWWLLTGDGDLDEPPPLEEQDEPEEPEELEEPEAEPEPPADEPDEAPAEEPAEEPEEPAEEEPEEPVEELEPEVPEEAPLEEPEDDGDGADETDGDDEPDEDETA